MYYEEEEEQMFLPEVNVFERVQYEVPSGSRVEIQNDPVKRFIVYTNAVALNLKNNSLLNITNDDVAAINEKVEVVRNSRYKNPIGFVLGYYLTRDANGSINTHDLAHVRKNLAAISPDRALKMVDVVRYARLWLTQL